MKRRGEEGIKGERRRGEGEGERERDRERGREIDMTSTLLYFTEFVRSRSKVLRQLLQITKEKTLMAGPLMKKMVRMI